MFLLKSTKFLAKFDVLVLNCNNRYDIKASMLYEITTKEEIGVLANTECAILPSRVSNTTLYRQFVYLHFVTSWLSVYNTMQSNCKHL